MTAPVRVPFEQLHSFVVSALLTTGMNTQNATTVANTLVYTDAMGVHTHGTKLLIGYIRKLQAGGYRADAVPSIEREGPSWGVVDGQSALGMIGCSVAMELAVKKAKQTGIAWVGLKHTAHVGAIGYYVWQGAKQGCIAMATGNDIPSVAIPGSRSSVLGSNPIAYAIPRLGHPPILLDMATAATAGGKVYAACQRGEPIPDTWLIGPDGKPTPDGSLYPANAALAPMAGHKGYGIGLWCEVLSAILPGGNHTWQVGSWLFDPPNKPSNHGASFMAIDVSILGSPEAFDKRLDELIQEIHAAPRADHCDRVYLPGEREWERLDTSLAAGIPLPSDVMEKLLLVRDATDTHSPFMN